MSGGIDTCTVFEISENMTEGEDDDGKVSSEATTEDEFNQDSVLIEMPRLVQPNPPIPEKGQKRVKKLAPKVSNDIQHLQLLKENSKRKLLQQSEAIGKEFMCHTNKMTKTMENMAMAMNGCFQMMQNMFEVQMRQQTFNYASPQPAAMSCPWMNSRVNNFHQRDFQQTEYPSQQHFSRSATLSTEDTEEPFLTLLK